MGNINVSPLGFPWETRDPFLFCAYHRDEYPAGNSDMTLPVHLKEGRNIGSDFTVKDGWRMYHGSTIPGFPYHPHRGFETITINHEGVVDHADSLGAAGRFRKGDVQWMTAGKGVLHSEMFPLWHQDAPNPLEIFQIWLNLPAKSKMVDPEFKMLWAEDIPIVRENNIEIQLLSGSFRNHIAPFPTKASWAANSENQVRIMTVKMEKESTITLPAISSGVHRDIYFYKGSEVLIEENQILVNNRISAVSQDSITIQNERDSAFFLVLEGRPIGEPVAQHGPFVMNTQEEIQRAFLDYRQTQFGGWPWPMQEVIHERSSSRFALHADGKREEMELQE